MITKIKSLSVFAFVLLALSVVEAGMPRPSNPLIRACRISGGLFEAVYLGSPEELGLCRYKSDAVDAQSVLSAASDKYLSMALAAFRYGPGISNCQQAGAQSTLIPTDLGLENFCEFTDGSMISLEVLFLSFQASKNVHLKELISF